MMALPQPVGLGLVVGMMTLPQPVGLGFVVGAGPFGQAGVPRLACEVRVVCGRHEACACDCDDRARESGGGCARVSGVGAGSASVNVNGGGAGGGRVGYVHVSGVCCNCDRCW